MLSSLKIQNYILLDSLEVTFPKGLVIISGSTGAGKSILLGAIGIALGGKGDASVLRDPSKNCIIEAEFTVEDSALKDLLTSFDLDFDDSIIIRRQIAPSGRSRAFINDIPVSVSQLQDLSPLLVDIHSQHQTLQITKDDFRLKALDSFAGNLGTVQMLGEVYSRKLALEADLQSRRRQLAESLKEGDYNASLLKELHQARLQEGEQEELEEELNVLENAEGIKESLYAASSILGEINLKEVLRQVGFLSKYYSSMQEYSSRLESARYEIEDIAADFENLNEKVNVDASRLDFVSDRLSQLYRLEKKHGVASVAELIDIRDRMAGEVFSAEDLQLEIEELERELAKVTADYRNLSHKLHDLRAKAAVPFAKAIQGRLHALEMENAAFEIKLEERSESATGIDKAVFLFSATGNRLMDASLKASGGELSRIMLSLKAELAHCKSVLPTMIFDEIDTGISGSVADKTGRMICEMGSSMQVFAITHLPQVAAKGSAHFLVEKTPDGASSIKQIQGDSRVSEIARMLSGSSITDAAIANAKSLMTE